MKKNTDSNSKGFTIIELLIATVVFSAILLVLTQVVIRLSGTYYHGVIQNQTLNVAKNITNNIVQQIQFTGGDVIFPGNPIHFWSNNNSDLSNLESYLCIGNNQYVYQIGGRFDNTTSNGSLVLSYNTQCSNGGPKISSSNWSFITAGSISSHYYVNLIPNGMRLAKFKIDKQFGNLYKVDVMVASGTDGINPNGPGFNNDQSNYNSTNYNPRCYPNSPYCATSELVTYVEKTVQ